MTTTRSPRDRETAYRAFFTATHDDLLRFVQRRVHPSHAEDVVADALLTAWRRFDDAPDSLDRQRAWAFGIARRCLLNTHRGLDRQEALSVRLAEAVPTSTPPGSDPDLIAARVDLAAAWRELTSSQQEVLALSVLDGLSAPDAARVLDTTPVAFRLRLMRARAALKARLPSHSTTLTRQNPEASRENA